MLNPLIVRPHPAEFVGLEHLYDHPAQTVLSAQYKFIKPKYKGKMAHTSKTK